MRLSGLILAPILIISSVLAQGASSTPYHKARVFITDSQSWQMSGGGGGSRNGFGGASRGGARPQTAEIIKTFGQRCPEVTVNSVKEKADYVVLLDHEGGKNPILHDNKVAVFNKDGDSIISRSTRSLGNAVKDACEVIVRDWSANSSRYLASPLAQATSASNADNSRTNAGSRFSISSTPDHADIELDGSSVGNTPSLIEATPGEHVISIKKAGYKTWERRVRATGGSANISAELEKEQ